jgi:signal transduction histidine kinase
LSNLQELSNNLLLLTRVHGIDKTKFSDELAIVEIIRDSCKKVAAPARKKNILIKTDISEHIIMGNKNSLVELFVIILDNAIKYSPADTEINIKTELANNTSQLSSATRVWVLRKKI